MTYSQRIAAAILVTVLGGATRAAAVPFPGPANLLVNPGFETGDFTGWTVGGNSPQFGVATDGTPIPNVSPVFNPTFQNVLSGDFAANALVKDDPFISGEIWRIVLTQNVAVLPNHDYVVGFRLGADSKNGFAMFINDQHTQIFIDGLGVLSPIGYVSMQPVGFQIFSNVFNSGSRTSIDVAFAINGGTHNAPAMSFDDLFVAEGDMVPGTVPEPGTLSLLALGLATAGLRRRLC